MILQISVNVNCLETNFHYYPVSSDEAATSITASLWIIPAIALYPCRFTGMVPTFTANG